jgi:hypothetical protein
MRSTRARHSASCSAEGVGMGVASLNVNSLLAIHSDPSQLRTITQTLWRPDVSVPQKGILYISVYYA